MVLQPVQGGLHACNLGTLHHSCKRPGMLMMETLGWHRSLLHAARVAGSVTLPTAKQHSTTSSLTEAAAHSLVACLGRWNTAPCERQMRSTDTCISSPLMCPSKSHVACLDVAFIQAKAPCSQQLLHGQAPPIWQALRLAALQHPAKIGLQSHFQLSRSQLGKLQGPPRNSLLGRCQLHTFIAKWQ